MQGRIVSTVYFEGVVYIFTEHGFVYEMRRDSSKGSVEFRLVHRMTEM